MELIKQDHELLQFFMDNMLFNSKSTGKLGTPANMVLELILRTLLTTWLDKYDMAVAFATALAKMIKWASTTASMVSAPSSKPMNVSVPAAASGAGDDDPFAPANNGAPLVLDMSNIPDPDDFDEGAVW